MKRKSFLIDNIVCHCELETFVMNGESWYNLTINGELRGYKDSYNKREDIWRIIENHHCREYVKEDKMKRKSFLIELGDY